MTDWKQIETIENTTWFKQTARFLPPICWHRLSVGFVNKSIAKWGHRWLWFCNQNLFCRTNYKIIIICVLICSFVLQRVRRYSDFKSSEMRQEEKSTIFKDIEMEPMAFGRESDTNDSLSNVVGPISISEYT